MFVFKRWFSESVVFRGETITCDLKHLTAFEEREVRGPVVRAMGAMDGFKGNAATADDVGEIGAKALAKVSAALSPEFLSGIFDKFVRNVGGVQDEDGRVRTDGPVILEFADEALMWEILLKLLGNGKVSAEEGKGSGSLSESGSAPAASGSVSPVTSTGSGDGPTPSTATPIPSAQEPSGVQDQSLTR